jgi:hypothetical protein
MVAFVSQNYNNSVAPGAWCQCFFRQSRQGAQRFLKQGQLPELPDQDGPLIMELPVGSRYAHTPAHFSREKIHGNR